MNLYNKILITGASGVIGQALIQELSAAGYKDITAISSKDVDLRNEVNALNFLKEIKPDLVFHLAAQVYGIMGNLANKAQVYLNNIRINTNLIEAAKQVGVKKIVAMGSAAIYSDEVPLPMSEDQVWKGAPHYSELAYAHSKRAMLAQLEAYRDQYGMDFAFCISTNLYGSFDRFDEKWGHVIPALISKFYRGTVFGEQVSVWGSGRAKRDFLFSIDAAHAMRLISEQFSGLINLATGESYTIRETAEMIKTISGYSAEIEWDITKPDGQVLRQYSIEKLKALGFKPRYTLEQGLSHTFHWFRQNLAQVRR